MIILVRIYFIFLGIRFQENKNNLEIKCAFGMDYFGQLILLFSLFLLLFIGLIALFGTIHGFHCTISANFYLYLQYFQQKKFNFSKINRFQTDTKLETQGLKI